MIPAPSFLKCMEIMKVGKIMTSVPIKYLERHLWLKPNHIKTSTWKMKSFP